LKELKKILEPLLGNKSVVIESPRSELLREKNQFCDLMERLDQVWKKDNSLFEEYHLDLSAYLEHYYDIIELQIIMRFGYNKAELIWWYILERKDADGKLLPIEDENGKEYTFENHSEFYEFLKIAEVKKTDEA
jgi:hypothetical protein